MTVGAVLGSGSGGRRRTSLGGRSEAVSDRRVSATTPGPAEPGVVSPPDWRNRYPHMWFIASAHPPPASRAGSDRRSELPSLRPGGLSTPRADAAAGVVAVRDRSRRVSAVGVSTGPRPGAAPGDTPTATLPGSQSASVTVGPSWDSAGGVAADRVPRLSGGDPWVPYFPTASTGAGRQVPGHGRPSHGFVNRIPRYRLATWHVETGARSPTVDSGAYRSAPVPHSAVLTPPGSVGCRRRPAWLPRLGGHADPWAPRIAGVGLYRRWGRLAGPAVRRQLPSPASRPPRKPPIAPKAAP
jgi:hypothetical protein